jgi:hypothetical protein
MPAKSTTSTTCSWYSPGPRSSATATAWP